MTDIALNKTETKQLVAAAGRGGSLVLPETMKLVTRDRLLARLLRDGLIAPADDEAGHQLTPAGYRAVGLRPPRARKAAGEPAPSDSEAPAKPGTKQGLLLELLGREQGASLAELAEATGWLPHTTRAALSRLRSAGKPVAKSKRDGEVTVYRILADEPAPRARKPHVEATVATAV